LIRLGDEKERQTLCADEGPYIPTMHYEQLRDVRVFMGHGTADEVIHYSRTRDFCEQLKTRNPDGNYQFVEYYGLGHGGTCKSAVMEGRVWSKMQDVKFKMNV
jgi:predicted esterase